MDTCPPTLSEPIFANPKSETLAWRFLSNRTLLLLKSLWITGGLTCSCKYSKPLAASSATRNRVSQSNLTLIEFEPGFQISWMKNKKKKKKIRVLYNGLIVFYSYYSLLTGYRCSCRPPLAMNSYTSNLWLLLEQYPIKANKYGEWSRLNNSTYRQGYRPINNQFLKPEEQGLNICLMYQSIQNETRNYLHFKFILSLLPRLIHKLNRNLSPIVENSSVYISKATVPDHIWLAKATGSWV